MNAVSVIMPTAATRDGEVCLPRALDSALSQEGVDPDVIVVANGQTSDPDRLATLARRRDIRLVRRHEAGLGPAISTGRDLVNAPCFAELDEDDVVLLEALATRLERRIAFLPTPIFIYNEDRPGSALGMQDGLIRSPAVPQAGSVHVGSKDTRLQPPRGASREWLR